MGLIFKVKCRWRCNDRPLSVNFSGAEGEDVDGCESSLSSGWDKDHGRFGWRVFDDGVINWFSHGQETSLSVAHIEALNPRNKSPIVIT